MDKPRGWLVDLLNYFGELGGFEKLKALVEDDAAGVVGPMHCLQPFGPCAHYLSQHCLVAYIGPMHHRVFTTLWNLEGKALHKEALGITTDDALWTTARSLRQLMPVLPAGAVRVAEGDPHAVTRLLLQTVLRLLKGESFPGVMGAVGILKRLMEGFDTPSQWGGGGGPEWISSSALADWILAEDILKIVFSRDTLDKTQ